MGKTPKIALIPTAYKTSKVYSVLPNDGSQDFDLARNSSNTRVKQDGLIELLGANMPRLDHLIGCPSFLVESNKTNRILQSENFGSWSKVNSTVTANTVVAPDGENTADLLQRSTATNSYLSRSSSKASASQIKMCSSVFVKKGEGDYFAIRAQGTYPARVDAIFKFSDKSLTVTQYNTDFIAIRSTVEEYKDEWYRISISYRTDTITTVTTLFSARSSSGVVDANDSLSTANAYIWGAQVEDGVGSTTYTSTGIGAVSTGQDNLKAGTGVTYTLGNAATFYYDFEVHSFKNSYTPIQFVVENASPFKSLSLDAIETSNPQEYFIIIRAFIENNSNIQNIISASEPLINLFVRNKIAVMLSGPKYIVYLNGLLIKEGTLSDTFAILNGATIRNDFSGNNRPCMRLYDYRVYDEVMTNEELKSLTEWI